MIRTAFQRIYSRTGRRAFSQSASSSAESKRKYSSIDSVPLVLGSLLSAVILTETPELAKKQGEKIRKEEKSKEQRPSPISDEAKRKFEEMNKKAGGKK